ncbi:Uncharacterized protein dnm_057740 [Desulfonema magnum]|uniref:Uncharacterized protein n=1 Tax=Desulfonema magnum TaxID=45655 RepID=A0A975BQP1_9BACT|nr:Uncharacterized protein dnm_057740 [Desulfonema magnum]
MTICQNGKSVRHGVPGTGNSGYLFPRKPTFSGNVRPASCENGRSRAASRNRSLP